MRIALALVTSSCLISLPATASIAQEPASWADRISLKGDLRLRFESIDEDNEVKRDRARYRARLGLSAIVNDDISVVVGLASGADNPVSRNVTFDDGFSTKDIGFELAYVDWAFADGWHLYGGKMKNPLFRAGGAPLIWDSDLNPEGISVRYSEGALFATAALFSVEERASGDDSLLSAVQLGGKFDLARNSQLTAGFGYLHYSSTVGNEPFFDGSSSGNSVDPAGNYLYGYSNAEVFAQLDTKLGDLPIAFFGQWVQNRDAEIADTGYAIGASMGLGKSDVSWTYQDIGADAVIGTFTDSDFGGGGADSSGHILDVSYPVRTGVSLGATLFLNKVDRFQGVEHDYTRLHLGLMFSFK